MNSEADPHVTAGPPAVAWSPTWRRALLCLFVGLGVVLLAYRETTTLMVGVWRESDTFAHGFIVLPISAWLAWRQRQAVAMVDPRPCWPALLPMGVAMLAWLAGHFVSVNSVTQFALVAMWVLMVPLVIGASAARVIMFPLGFLFFMVPIGEFMLPLLMEWTADFTVLALTITGIPVYREGQQFIIPSGSWSVVEACSGVRYLIASVMVGTLFAHLNYRAMWRRWVFVGVAIVVPIVANWVRAYLIVMLGHLSNNRIAVGVDHLIYGWVFFGVVIMLMFWIGARWAEPEPDQPVHGRPIEDRVPARGSWRLAPWAAAAMGVLLTSTAPIGSAVLDGSASSVSPRLELPEAIGVWRAQEPGKAPQDWLPSFHNPRALATRGYRGPDGDVVLNVAYFRAQDYGSKLVTSMHRIATADSSTWNHSVLPPVQVAGATWRLALLQGSPALSSISRTQKILVARTYWVDGRFTSSDVEAKVLTAASRLLGRGDDGAVVMVHAVADDEAEASRRIVTYLQQAQTAVDAALRTVRERR